MKIIYTALFMVFTITITAQEPLNFQNQKSDEIVGFKLYPNPAYDDVVYLTSKTNGIKDVTVYDIFGESVLNDRVTNSILNISRLVSGVYLLKVTEDKKTITRKLVVK